MAENDIGNMFGTQTESLEKQAETLAVFIATHDDEITKTKERLSVLEQELVEAKTNLATMMIQNGIESLKLSNGLSPKAKTQTKYFKVAGIEDVQLFDWLNANNMGEIIKPFVHFQTLQSALQQFVDQGGEVPAELITVNSTPTITLYGKSKFLAGRDNGQ